MTSIYILHKFSQNIPYMYQCNLNQFLYFILFQRYTTIIIKKYVRRLFDICVFGIKQIFDMVHSEKESSSAVYYKNSKQTTRRTFIVHLSAVKI